MLHAETWDTLEIGIKMALQEIHTQFLVFSRSESNALDTQIIDKSKDELEGIHCLLEDL